MKWTIGSKLFTGFGVMLLLIGAAGAVGWQSTMALSTRSDDLFRRSVRDTVHLAQAEDALWRLRYGFAQFLVLTVLDDRRKIADDEPKLYAIVNDNVKAYRDGAVAPEERAALQEWDDWWTKYTGARPRWFELMLAGKTQEAAEWRAKTTTPYGAGAVKSLANLIDLQRSVALKKHADETGRARASATMLIGVLTAAALALGGAITWLITRSIARPLRGQTVKVLTASQELAGVSEQLSSGAQNQASSLEETAASLHQMTELDYRSAKVCCRSHSVLECDPRGALPHSRVHRPQNGTIPNNRVGAGNSDGCDDPRCASAKPPTATVLGAGRSRDYDAIGG